MKRDPGEDDPPECEEAFCLSQEPLASADFSQQTEMRNPEDIRYILNS